MGQLLIVFFPINSIYAVITYADGQPDMPVFNLFSKRAKREIAGAPDVYSYDSIPPELRVQIIHIWTDALGHPAHDFSERMRDTYYEIVAVLRREYGLFSLTADNFDPHNKGYAFEELSKFFVGVSDVNRALDVIELTFSAIDTVTRDYGYLNRRRHDEIANQAIEELNARFKEHAVGYYYSDRRILRVDSELVHQEVVKPALVVLRRKEFQNAQAEFLAAHEHYRQGKKSEALVECYKAFESTMKVICTKRGWAIPAGKGAADLVRACLDHGLIPPYWQAPFGGLRSVLESAIPTPRNKQAGHGAGAAPVQIPSDELVAYVLHMTAATILFLSEAERKLP